MAEVQSKTTKMKQLPEGWELKKIIELCDEITDGSHYSPTDALKGKHYIASVKDFSEYGFDIKSCKKISEKDYLDLIKNGCVPNCDDVLLSKDGTMGIVYVSRGEPIALLSSIAIIKPNKQIYPKYLAYFLKDKRTQDELTNNYSSGSALPRIVLKDLKELKIAFPINLQEQRSIANMLSSIDAKIEINRGINRTLEAIGQLLFKHWFIDFEFLDEKGKPYKSSGGKMVDSELGLIPEGWEVKRLTEAADFLRGFSYRGSEKGSSGRFLFITLNSIYEGGGFKREFCYMTSERLKGHHFIEEGDIIITNTEQTKRGTLIGFPALVEFPQERDTNLKAAFSHHITKVIPKKNELKHYLMNYLSFNQKRTVGYTTGSVILGLDVQNWIKNEKIIIPPFYQLKEYHELMENIFRIKLNNNNKNDVLSKIRELLLPKLMSGKVRVPISDNVS